MAALVPAALVALVMLFGVVNSLQLQVLSGRPSLRGRVTGCRDHVRCRVLCTEPPSQVCDRWRRDQIAWLAAPDTARRRRLWGSPLASENDGRGVWPGRRSAAVQPEDANL